jgi:hypothetical protein
VRARLESLGLALALLLVVAYLGSFGLALGRRGPPHGEPPAGPAPPAHALPEPGQDTRAIRVEVLNGAGRAGLARAATDRLRGAGFDVVYFGNAPAADASVVLDRTGRPDHARAVADRLGIPRVETRPDATLMLDVTVVLGADWPTARPPN